MWTGWGGWMVHTGWWCGRGVQTLAGSLWPRSQSTIRLVLMHTLQVPCFSMRPRCIALQLSCTASVRRCDALQQLLLLCAAPVCSTYILPLCSIALPCTSFPLLLHTATPNSPIVLPHCSLLLPLCSIVLHCSGVLCCSSLLFQSAACALGLFCHCAASCSPAVPCDSLAQHPVQRSAALPQLYCTALQQPYCRHLSLPHTPIVQHRPRVRGLSCGPVDRGHTIQPSIKGHSTVLMQHD